MSMRAVSSKIAIFVSCGLYISFEISYLRSKLLCLSMQSPNGFSSTSKQMTLNDLSHSAYSVFRVESFSMAALSLRHDCFKLDEVAYKL